MLTFYTLMILAVGLERIIELRISHRHAKQAFKKGGMEFGQGHFVAMRLLHTAFLLGCLVEVYALDRHFLSPWGWLCLGGAICAQLLRYWAVISLGEAWNVRVIVVPGSTACRSGPYRYFRHPNYVAVILEGMALPLIHGAFLTAIIFSTLNLFLLKYRVACEEKALRTYLQGYP